MRAAAIALERACFSGGGQLVLTDRAQEKQPKTPSYSANNMNNGNPEIVQPDRPATPSRISRSAGNGDELSRLKRELIQTEVKLGRARATVTVAELDIRAINARIRELAK